MRQISKKGFVAVNRDEGNIVPYTFDSLPGYTMNHLLNAIGLRIHWGRSVSIQEDRRKRKQAEIEAGQTPYEIVPATLTLD